MSEEYSCGVLPVTDDVMKQLVDKHPIPQEAQLGCLSFGPIEDVPSVVFNQIDGEMVKESALRTKGSGGPSGIDSKDCSRVNLSKSLAGIYVMP